jgi:hypothetical protein
LAAFSPPSALDRSASGVVLSLGWPWSFFAAGCFFTAVSFLGAGLFFLPFSKRGFVACLVFTPIPLSNVVPALVIALISLAYLEEDGLLLSIALLAAVIVLTVELMAVWEAVLGAKWISGLW